MSRADLVSAVSAALARLREGRPLVHHITNFVVMNDTANVTLLIGASPVMAHAREEVEAMVSLAGALVLNPGTLDDAWLESMLLAGRRARERGVPIVLDPVGAGATDFRTRSNQRLIRELEPTVVRGNAGEIGALAGAGGTVRGVDSLAAPEDPGSVVRGAAREWGGVVAITGPRDLISDGERLLAVDNGHPWLASLTGTGCMATAMIGAFAAVEKVGLIATTAALAAYGVAAERAAQRSIGPGSFRPALFDELFSLTPDRLADAARVSELG